MVEFLTSGGPLTGEWAADRRQHLGRADRARPLLGISQQLGQAGTLMGVGDGAAQRAPPPLDPVGVRVIGGGVDQHQVLAQLGQQPPQPPRALRVWMPRLSKITMASRCPRRPARHHTRVRVGGRASSTSSCSYRSARPSSPSSRGRSWGTSSSGSARVASGTRSAAGGGTGDAAAAASASTPAVAGPPRLSLGLARPHPAGPLAQVPGAVQRHPDRLDPGAGPVWVAR
jgi:hypothetical protein